MTDKEKRVITNVCRGIAISLFVGTIGLGLKVFFDEYTIRIERKPYEKERYSELDDYQINQDVSKSKIDWSKVNIHAPKRDTAKIGK